MKNWQYNFGKRKRLLIFSVLSFGFLSLLLLASLITSDDPAPPKISWTEHLDQGTAVPACGSSCDEGGCYFTPYGSPYGDPYGTPYGSPYSSPYDSPYSSPYGTPYGSPYGTPYSSPSGYPYPYPTPYGTPYGTPSGGYSYPSPSSPLADITTEHREIDINGVLVAGNNITFTSSVRNQGGGPSGETIARWCLNGTEGECYHSSGTQINTQIVPWGLGSGQDTPLYTSQIWTAVAGTRLVWWCSDVTLSEVEPNEDNNCHSRLFTVVAANQCSDGIDNDGDGLVDLADAGCANSGDDNEQNACNDGIDNDGDGKIDLADPGCGNSQDNNETNLSAPDFLEIPPNQ